jgi:HEAT repeat protein
MKTLTGARRRGVALIAVAAVGLAGYGLSRDRSTAGAEPRAASPSAAPAVTVVWETGARHTFALSWRSRQRATLFEVPGHAGAPVLGAMALEGDVAFDVRAGGEGVTTLALAFPRLTAHAFALGGEDALATDDAVRSTFAGREAFVDVAPSGAVLRVRHAKDAPPLFRAITRAFVRQIDLRLPAERLIAWTGHEPGPSGDGPVRYRLLDEAPIAIERVRAPYATLLAVDAPRLDDREQQLSSYARIALDPAGHLASITEKEQLSVTRKPSGVTELASQLEFRLDARGIEVRPRQGPAAASDLEEERGVPGLSRHAQDTHVAGGWTLEGIEEVLLQYATKKTPPAGFLDEAAAYLRLHPEACAGLATLFPDARLGRRGRELLLDVLAAAGSEEAESAMRDALSDPSAKDEPRSYAGYLGRLASVDRPAPESVALLRRVAEAADADVRDGATGALGLAARRLGTSEPARSRAIADELASRFRAAASARERGALVHALGKAGSPHHVSALTSAAGDSDASVRTSAATALSGTRSPEGVAALVRLLGDPNEGVQRLAMEALVRTELSPGDMRTVSALVLSNRTSPALDEPLVGFLAGTVSVGAPVRAALEHLLVRNADNPRLTSKIQALLERLST